MYKITPTDNIFKTISVQTTYKCQMKCNNCYLGDMLNNPVHKDVDPIKLEKALSKLPYRCDIRFIGAEPTMNPHLFDLIKIVRKTGHRPSLLTNGLKLRNSNYTKDIKAAGINMLGLSMNGGLDDDMYQLMDNGKYAYQKEKALENCFVNKIVPHVNVIMIPENVHVIKPLAKRISELAKFYNMDRFPIMLRIKSVGEIGNYMNTHTYSLPEMLQIVNYELDGITDINFNINGYEEKNTCTFKFDNLHGKITDWTVDDEGIPDSGSTRRGILTDDYMLAPFFEYYKEKNNEDS